MDEEQGRKLQAKRLNENIKLFATTLNASALIVLGGGVLQPLFSSSDAPVGWQWIAVSVMLHLLAHGFLRRIRLE